jgi:AraC-like DNA-binding protein
MLAQPIIFEDELPVTITLADITEYPIHYHEDTELLFLLSGSLLLRNGYYRYTMRAGDIFITNSKELHAYYKNEDEANIALILQIDNGYFSSFHPEFANSFFVPDLDDPNTPEMDAMREILARIIMESLDGGEGYEQRIIEQMHSLVSLLMESFQNFRMEKGRFVNSADSKRNPILAERMNRIQDYLYENYGSKLTLQEIADREHLSVYYLSHVIKSSTGMSFKDFLSFVRVEESERLLLATDMKITAISEAVGFSAVRYYIKYFERWYGMTPQEYREGQPGDADDEAARFELDIRICDHEKVREQIRHLSNTVYRAYRVVPESPPHIITADVNESKGGTDLAGTALGRMFSDVGESKKAEALLFDLLTDLGEPVVGSGHDYIITGGRDTEGAAALIYNTDARKRDKETFRKEFLVKIKGFSGQYFVRRIRLSSANITAAADVIRLKKTAVPDRDNRGILHSLLASYPVVTDTIMTAAGVMTFQ